MLVTVTGLEMLNAIAIAHSRLKPLHDRVEAKHHSQVWQHSMQPKNQIYKASTEHTARTPDVVAIYMPKTKCIRRVPAT